MKEIMWPKQTFHLQHPPFSICASQWANKPEWETCFGLSFSTQDKLAAKQWNVSPGLMWFVRAKPCPAMFAGLWNQTSNRARRCRHTAAGTQSSLLPQLTPISEQGEGRQLAPQGCVCLHNMGILRACWLPLKTHHFLQWLRPSKSLGAYKILPN